MAPASTYSPTSRFQPATLNFKVRSGDRLLTLPDLAILPIRELAAILGGARLDRATVREHRRSLYAATGPLGFRA